LLFYVRSAACRRLFFGLLAEWNKNQIVIGILATVSANCGKPGRVTGLELQRDIFNQVLG